MYDGCQEKGNEIGVCLRKGGSEGRVTQEMLFGLSLEGEQIRCQLQTKHVEEGASHATSVTLGVYF